VNFIRSIAYLPETVHFVLYVFVTSPVVVFAPFRLSLQVTWASLHLPYYGVIENSVLHVLVAFKPFLALSLSVLEVCLKCQHVPFLCKPSFAPFSVVLVYRH
jgi:hypothetical protein